MKKFLYIISLLFVCATACYSQEDEGNGEKVRERMKEYIQKKLDLSSSEGDRFGPLFLNYSNDLKKAKQDAKSDNLLLQQKTAEIRLHYRDEFKNIMGEKRSNDVFKYERDFIEELKRLLKERTENKVDTSSNKRSGG